MPTGKDESGERRGSTTKKNAFCSFCRKSYRDVGPLVEGPGIPLVGCRGVHPVLEKLPHRYLLEQSATGVT